LHGSARDKFKEAICVPNEEDDMTWRAFETFIGGFKEGDKILLEDVPFPMGQDARKMRAEEVSLVNSKSLKLLMMRWHPDKFNQKYGGLLDEVDAPMIQERVKDVFQLVTAAKAFITRMEEKAKLNEATREARRSRAQQA